MKTALSRDLSGFLIVDKPSGVTSNHVLQKIKHLFGVKKAGHTGTLDPLATGMLIIAFNEATKVAQYVIDANKSYLVTATLGVTTVSGDSDSEILTQTDDVPSLSEEQVLTYLSAFTGPLRQLPPMVSALKYKGRPLYSWARAGVEVPRAERLIHIDNVKYHTHTHNTITFEVACSKGTYVRSLVESLGEKIGCGAHVSALRRLSVGDFQSDAMQTLDWFFQRDKALLSDSVLPITEVLTDVPVAAVTQGQCKLLMRGQSVMVPGLSFGLYQITLDGQFVGLGVMGADGWLHPKRVCQQGTAA